MVICPDCKKEVPDAKFCKNCGASLLNVQKDIEIELPNEEVDITQKSAETQNSLVKTTFCSNCGFKIHENFTFCPNCGKNLNAVNGGKISRAGSEKNIILSIILSVIFPGLGQIYLGLNKKGAYFLIGYVISVILILLVIGMILCIVIWIWALVDTIQSTNAINRGEEVEDKLF